MSRFFDIINQQDSYKSRVFDFWVWFSKNHIRLTQTITQGSSDDLSAETIAQVDRLVPGISWSYGRGTSPGRHSFTLSAQSNPHWVYLTRFWLDCAPGLENWDFHCFKQALPMPASASSSSPACRCAFPAPPTCCASAPSRDRKSPSY